MASSRASPICVVSPETPALKTTALYPSARNRRSRTGGKASFVFKPKPAVRLSPKAAMRNGSPRGGGGKSRRKAAIIFARSVLRFAMDLSTTTCLSARAIFRARVFEPNALTRRDRVGKPARINMHPPPRGWQKSLPTGFRDWQTGRIGLGGHHKSSDGYAKAALVRRLPLGERASGSFSAILLRLFNMPGGTSNCISVHCGRVSTAAPISTPLRAKLTCWAE